MKKLLSLICIFSTMVLSSFANSIFSDRYFEVFANVPVDLSNNAFTLEDVFFTGDGHVVLDLEDFNSLPESGFNIAFNTSPVAGFKLDLPRALVIGANIGVDASMGARFSKDFFTLLSSGYKTGDELNLEAKKFDIDVFGTIQADLGWNTKKASLVFHPTVFIPIVHAAPDDVSVVFQNTENGDFILTTHADFSVFTNTPLATDGRFDANTIISEFNSYAKSSLGFDMGVDYSWDIFRFLTIGAGARIPLKPGKLSYKTSSEYSNSFTFNANDLLKKNNEETEEDDAEQADSESETESTGISFTDSVYLGEDYYGINRPFKFYVSGDFHPFGDWLSVYGSLGFTAKHAFEKKIYYKGELRDNFYIDYLLGGRLSLIGMLNLDLSTEHTNQIYAHTVGLDFNFRLIEIGAGVSLASPTFLKSFAASGVAAYANVAIGF